MNKKRLHMLIDFFLAVVFILLYLQHVRVLKTALHEILGVVVVLPIIIHVILNWKWLKGNFLSKKVNNKWMFFLSIGLAFTVGITVISGIAIWCKVGSISVTHGLLLQRSDIRFWAHMHQNAAAACLVLILLHIWVHKKHIRSFFRL